LDLSPTLEINTEVKLEEMLILLEIRNKKYDSIKLKFKNGKLDLFEGVEVLDKNNKIRDLLNDYDFQEIEIKKQAGNIVLLRRKNKIKFS